MSSPSLENLHREFDLALGPTSKKKYLGPDQNNPTILIHTLEKSIRLAEVFKLASVEIEERLEETTPLSKDKGHCPATFTARRRKDEYMNAIQMKQRLGAAGSSKDWLTLRLIYLNVFCLLFFLMG